MALAALERIPCSQWAFTGMARAPDPQGPRWAGGGRWGFWCVALPRSSWTTPGSGALRSAQSPKCPGIPLGPFEVAAHAPVPSLPCLPKRSGFSRLFTFHTDVGLNGLRRLLRGISAHWTLSPVPPPRSCKSSPPFSTFLPTSSVPPWHPFPTAVPVHRPAHTHPLPTPTKYPQVFDLPETQVYCKRCDGPASRMATHTIWGFFRCTLMLAPPQPSPYPKCPGETSGTGHCSHHSQEGGSAKPRKEACTFWTETRPDLCQQLDVEIECAFLKKRSAERRRTRQSGGRSRQRREEAA